MKRIWILCTLLIFTACAAPIIATPTNTPTSTPPSTPTHVTAAITTSTIESQLEPTIPTISSDNLEPTATNVYPDCAAGVIIFRSEYGGGVTQLYAICPDGTSLVEVSPDNNLIKEYLDYQKVEDALEKPISSFVDDAPVELMHATLSFDEKYVAYSFLTGYYAYGLNIIDVETDTVSTIIEPVNDDSQFAFILNWLSWSPTSYQLLIHGGTVPVQVLNITCDDASHICDGKTAGGAGKFVEGYSIAQWSPDGTLIAYPGYTANQVNDSIEIKHSICIQNAQGDLVYEFEDMTLGLSEIGSIQWSPDGTTIAFTANLQGSSNSDVFLLSLSDGALINLTSNLSGGQVLLLWRP